MKIFKVVVRSMVAVGLTGAGVLAVAGAPAQAATGVGSLAGSVRDTKGAVVANASISVIPVDGFDAVARVTTDGAGRWQAPGLELGAYQVQIGLGGWSEWAPGQRDFSTAVKYTVKSGRTTKVGSVVTAAGVITGKLLTADGSPAANVRVAADDYNAGRVWTTTTSSAGTYELRVAPGADYVVSFVDGHFQQFSPGTVDQNQATRYPVVSGRTLHVDDRLLTAPSVTGRLVDATGAPVAGATVEVLTDTAFQLTTTTDADGNYRFDKLHPWTVKVAFHTGDDRVQWAYQKATYDEATSFTLAVGTVTTVNDTLLP